MASLDFQRGDSHVGFFPDMSPKASFLSGLRNMTFEDNERFGRYAAFYDFYNGKHWKKPRPDNERQVTANFARLFVNKGASYMTAKPWCIEDKDDVGSEEQLQFLNDVWDINNRAMFFFESCQLGGIFGDVFWVFLPNSEKGISIHAVAPMFVKPIFHPTNKGHMIGAIIEYPLNMETSSGVGGKGPGLLTMMLDAYNITQFIDGRQVYSVPHGIGEVPLVFIRNRPEAASTYGTSDIAPMMDMNRLYNEKLQDMSDIINYHAAPVTLAYGISMKKIQRGARKVWSGLPNPKDAKIENLELKGDMAAADNHMKQILDILFMLAEMPEVAFGKVMSISNTTGLAMQLMFGPLIDTLNIKHMSYGQGIVHANRILTKYGIRMGYLKAPSVYTWLDLAKFYMTSIDWPSPLPVDELLRLNMVISKLNQGLITYYDALSQLGVANVKKYAKAVLDDITSGRNLVLANNVNNALSNIGGINRNNSTVSNNNGSINYSSARNQSVSAR